MATSYRAVMDGTYDNHLLPFLWMKGEDHATITEYLEKISGADIHEVCLESRTHPDFCGDGWWRDLRFVIDECKRLGMKIWILDDAHFPTGYANGKVAEHPERAKVVLTHRTFDVAGPARGLSVPLTDPMDPTQQFVGVAGICDGKPVAIDYRIVPAREKDAADTPAGEPGADASDGAGKGNATASGMAAMMAALAQLSRQAPADLDRIVFDVPEGTTKVFILATSRRTDYNPDYINMVDKESCDTLIEAIYEPHFAHVGDEFGKTILGFFSDEPGFANEKSGKDETGGSDSLIGKATMLLSGGIDSPVAAYSLLRRGIKIECVHFASPPYTSEAVIDKLKDILYLLTPYQSDIRLDVVPFTKIQEAIYEHVPEPYCITIMRRMMVRIAAKLASSRGSLAIASGESIGQVASQTLESMQVINEVTSFPFLRPLCVNDKVDVIDKAKEIGTFDISIRPFEDCCTIFKPRHPKTKPDLAHCLRYEALFDYEKMIEEAINGISPIFVSR